MNNTIDKKQFALEQIAPYYKDPSTCGVLNDICANLTPDSKMCVAGKNLLPEVREAHPTNGVMHIFETYENDQSKVFIESSRDILGVHEWSWLQSIHDAIALSSNLLTTVDDMHTSVSRLFTLKELEEYCKTH